MNRIRKTTLLLLLAGMFILGAAVTAQALVPVDLTTYGTGDRYNGDGNTESQGSYVISPGFNIHWDIYYNVAESEYEYTYTITNNASGSGGIQGELSSNLMNLYFLVSPTFQPIEPGEISPTGWTVGDVTAGGKNFHAMYWENLNSGDGYSVLEVHFDALVAPVWGSFYADDGGSSSANNGDFAHFLASGTNFADYIPVPDTVPLPPAVWLFGSGLLGLAGFRRKFKK